MALNFPNSPTVGQVYTDTTSGFSYEWDGTVWKSYSPASASNIKILDDISGSFNDSTQTFALASNGVSLTPANAQSLLITLGGVVQEPGVDYTVSTSNITFTTAPSAALSFSGVSLGPAVPITYANDGNIYVRKTYTGAGTTGPFAFTEGYAIGYLDVYRNGVRLSSGTDFVGTSGTNFFLTDSALTGDEIEAIGYSITSLVDATSNLNQLNVTGITTLTNVNVSGVITATTFSGNATSANYATTAGVSTYATTAGIATNAQGLTGTPNITVGILTAVETRTITGAEKVVRTSGNTVTLTYSNSSSSNVGYTTNPTGDITLNVVGIPTGSNFDDHSITFAVIVNSTGVARTVTAVNLNGVAETIRWSGGSLASALAGVTTTNGHTIFNFTGINTVGSASTAANYTVFGIVSGGFF